MPKELNTLVRDIYSLFGDNPHECDKQRVQEFGQRISSVIASRLAEVRTKPKVLRMSSIGKPARQQWYDIKGNPDSEKLGPSTKIKFLFGDIWEQIILFLAEEAGHSVSDQQSQVEVNGVPGSIDAVIDGVVVDVKSASSQSFKKFEYGTLQDNDGFGYMEQLAGYVEGKDLGTGGAFLAVDKTLGKLALLPFDKEELEQYRIPERIDYLREVLDQDEPPERCYVPTAEDNGNQKLAMGCNYCPHKQLCWADANDGVGLRTFAYSTGPRHYVHIEKEPRVEEITF